MTLTCSLLIAATLAGVPAGHEDAPGRAAIAPATLATIAAPGLVPRVEPLREQGPLPVEPWMVDRAERRPSSLPVMYAAFAGLQALDVYSTRKAIGAGASEANPLMRGAARHGGTMLAVKALATAGTIYFTERAWKKNRKGAVILMAAINGVTAAIAARNFRNARR